MRRFYFLLLLLAGALYVSAQDLIVYKDGRRVSCRIDRIDSTNIYCRMGGRQFVDVPRSSVQSYYLSKKSRDRINKGPGGMVAMDKEGLFLFGIGAGLSNPTAEFADQNIYSELSGLALPGFAFNGSMILKAGDIFGLKLAFRSQRHHITTDEIRNNLMASLPGINISIDSQPWRLNGLFGGITMRIPFRSVEGLRLNLDFDAGIPRCAYSSMVITASANGQSVVLEQRAESVSSPAWSAGGGLSYRVAEEVALSLFVEYVQCKPTFAIGIYENGAQVGSGTYQQLMKVLNVGVGICLVPARK